MTTPDRPNIILLTNDCWRADCLGVYNNIGESPSPNLDRFCEQSALFEQAITCGGWTRPAMMALFSSLYASHHNGGSLKQISPDVKTISELLQEAGYHTAGFTANLVCGSSAGFQRGFDHFSDDRSQQTIARLWNRLSKIRGFNRVASPFMRLPLTYRLFQLLGLKFRLPEATPSAREITDRALAWLSDAQTPFFLWVHYIDLHWPYRLSRRQDHPKDLAQAWKDRRTYRQVMRSKGAYDPGEETGKRWWTLYREEMLSVDENMQRIFEAVQQKGFWDQTAIALTGDHGEEFYERGTWAHSWNQLFDEGIQVPFILRQPGQTQAQRVHQQVSHLEITPTLLDLASVAIPETMLGRSLLDLLNANKSSENSPIRPYALTEMLGHRNSFLYRMALRSENKRYIYNFEQAKDKQLYQRRQDPAEKHNVYDNHSPDARQFDHMRLDHLAPVVPEMMEEKVEDAFADLDPDVAERLRDLGYLS